MNNRGQIGMLLVIFIGVIVGVTLFITISQTVGEKTSTASIVNHTITGTGSSVVNLYGQAVIGDVTVVNSTSGSSIPSTLFTVADNQVVDGVLTATLTRNATGKDITSAWKATYTYEPDGYIGGANRSIALLIPIMFALAIALIALLPTLRSDLMSLLGK